MSISARRCAASALDHGVQQVHAWTSEQLPAGRFPPALLHARGQGYGLWKPHIILDSLGRCAENDILIYADAGVEFIGPVRAVIESMRQDVFLFGNHFQHAHWCKRDIVEAIMPGAPWESFDTQVQGSALFLRVTSRTYQLVADWLGYCLIPALIDDSPSWTPNHPLFRENRHEQAILTTLAYRDRIGLHWWPACYRRHGQPNERGNYADENYPILFFHHRRRNADWLMSD